MAKKCLITCDHCGSTSDDPKNQGDYKGIREGVKIEIVYKGIIISTIFGPVDLCRRCFCNMERTVQHALVAATAAEAS